MADDHALGSLELQIREHWRKYRPEMYAELQKAGKLQETCTLPRSGRAI